MARKRDIRDEVVPGDTDVCTPAKNVRKPRAPAIGIDLGTAYSCVAVFRHGRVEVIANDQGNRTTPSCVAFTDSERLIGGAAMTQFTINPDTTTVFDVKRLIGRRYADRSVQDDIKQWPFTVIDRDGNPSIQVEFKGQTRTLTPEEVTSMILAKMKKTAEAYLGMTVKNAVVSVPAKFNNSQRRATIDACTIAGLNVRIINEPTAASLAYGLFKKVDCKQTILIYDLGGGCLDVSILTIEDRSCEVKTTTGDTHLGGEDFTNSMVNHCLNEFEKQFDKDISDNRIAVCRLRAACEEAKCTLSSLPEVAFGVRSLYESMDFRIKFTRELFEELNAELFHQALETVEKCLCDARMDKTEIDEIVLVGGSTHIPRIQRQLQDYFNGKDVCCDLNCDEAVAHGSAIQAAILQGRDLDVMIRDVMPLTLRTDTTGGGLVAVPFLHRNTTVPVQQTVTFTPTSDNQTNIQLLVCEGERIMVKDNNLLGKFQLGGFTPGPRGVPQIEVTFEIDENGILSTSACEKTAGIKNRITITSDDGRLTKEELERLVADAAKY